MSLFYHNDPFDTDRIALSKEEAAHAFQVLRLQIGDRIQVTNGQGALVSTSVELISRKACVLQVLNRTETGPERKGRIHVGLAPTKSIDRFEWFLEKATEIGIDRITPVITEHSERRKLRHDRSLKVLIAAMKQSRRTWLPQLDELTLLPDFLRQELPARRAFGWCNGEHGSFMNWYQPQDSIILIGPEGDFSTDEAQQLQQTGFVPVSIGNSRLRTETAGVAVCTWMSLSQQS